MSSINHGATFKTKRTLSNLKGLLKKEKNPKENSFQDWLQIEKIENNSILFRDNRVIKILKVSPINFKLKSKLEQEAILNSYKLFLRNLNSKIQIVVLSKKTDISQHIQEIQKNTNENSPIYEMGEDYIRLIKKIISQKNTISKEFFAIVEINLKIENEIEKIKEYLEYCGNEVEICDKEQIINVLKNFTNKRLMSL